MNMLSGNTIPAEAINNAQVAFDNGATWVIIGNHHKLSGLTSHFQMPSVTCPIVHTERISDDEAMNKIIKKYVSSSRVTDLDRLLHDLVEIGAHILNIPELGQ